MAGLYIHIPFCHSKCSYCDFFSTPKTDSLTNYISGLEREWDLRKSEIDEPISTIYIGGGTPSIIKPDMLARLIKHIKPTSLEEMTIEANPEDVTPQWVEAMAYIGFDRISMGVQSFDDEQLAIIGRRHTGQQALTAARLINSAGMKFNLDLIYGLPGQDTNSWKQNLDIALEIMPGHLSAYLLSYERGTRLWAMRESGKLTEADDDTVFKMYDILMSATRSCGYRHYEISNFAQPGHEAIHNTNYWLGIPYIGLGVSAHSFDGKQRRINPISINRYIDSLSRDETIFEIDEEDDTDRLNDMIITRLRTDTGLSITEIGDRFGETVAETLLKASKPLLESGKLLQPSPDMIAIPESEYLRSDAIMRELIFVH